MKIFQNGIEKYFLQTTQKDLTIKMMDKLILRVRNEKMLSEKTSCKQGKASHNTQNQQNMGMKNIQDILQVNKKNTTTPATKQPEDTTDIAQT